MSKEGGTHIDSVAPIRHHEYRCAKCNADFYPQWKSCQRCGSSNVSKRESGKKQRDN